jgi:dienelactone hydrolase
MHLQTPARRRTLLLALLVVWGASLAGPAVAQKKPITHDVYDTWRSIQDPKLSQDGTWLAYALVAQEGDGEMVVRNLRTGIELRQPRGTNPLVTVDGKFVVYAVAPPRAAIDKAKKEKKKPDEMPKSGMGILDLATGKAVTVDRVKSFTLPEESAGFLAYLLEAPEKKAGGADEKKEEAKPGEKEGGTGKPKEKKKEPGTDLVIRNLSTGAETRVAEVVEYAWDKAGDRLLYAVSSKKPEGDGAFVRTVADGRVRTLLGGLGHYTGLVFDESGTQLAFVSDRDTYKAEASPYTLYYWAAPAQTAVELVSSATPGMPAGAAVSENLTPAFSKDGHRLFLGTAPAPKATPPDAPEPIKVDIWHYKDPELQSMQKVNADQERKRSFRAVVTLDDRKLVQLASADMPEIRLNGDATRALGQSNVPYRQLVSWDSNYDDFYTVNFADGARRRIIEKSRFGATLSPGGGYALYFDDKDANWYAVRCADAQVIKLTDRTLGVRFDNETSNTPEPARPWGVAGWTEGDHSVLVYDRFDIWELRPDGAAPRMVTNGLGRRQHLVFRYQRTEAEEGPGGGPRVADKPDEPIKLDKPLLLLVTDDVTKASGFYRVTLPPLPAPAPAQAKAGRKRSAAVAAPASGPLADPVRLLMADKLVGGLIKAKHADTVVFTEQRFEEFPNLWVSDLSFTDPRRVSDANPQQAGYIWGRSELIDYVNADGVRLRAILTKPEDFDSSRKYPLMVYIYEELTGGLHRFVPPAPGTSINVTRFVSNGYIVLQPDIVYDTGYPGQSAMKCVIPAVERVVALGYVDPQRIGIQGHSWGGYQITYMVTRTNLFRAVEAGAAVSDMVSAYGGIRWGTGMSRAFQYERTQSRIGAPPWQRPLQFIENSPIFWVENVQTPYLTIHNDEDDAVPWYQGIEFFSALRRLGKEAYLFVYNGEKHGLHERDNQKHWTVHLCEFFDYYLKDAPKPEWMDKGVPYLEKGTRDVSGLFKKSEGATK